MCRNVANNRFTGWIPNELKKINSLQYVLLNSWFYDDMEGRGFN